MNSPPESINSNIIFISLAFIGVILSRVENGLFLLGLILFGVYYIKIDVSKIKIALNVGLLSNLVYYLYLLYVTYQYSDIILKPWSSLLVIGLSILTIFLVYYEKIKDSIMLHLDSKTLFVILTIGIAIQLFFDFDDTIISLSNILSNLFFSGKWAGYWVLAILSLGYLIYRKVRGLYINDTVIYCLIFSVAIVWIIVGMGMFRPPYRVGYGDSANRLMITVYPFMSIAIVYFIHTIFRLDERQAIEPK